MGSPTTKLKCMYNLYISDPQFWSGIVVTITIEINDDKIKNFDQAQFLKMSTPFEAQNVISNLLPITRNETSESLVVLSCHIKYKSNKDKILP